MDDTTVQESQPIQQSSHVQAPVAPSPIQKERETAPSDTPSSEIREEVRAPEVPAQAEVQVQQPGAQTQPKTADLTLKDKRDMGVTPVQTSVVQTASFPLSPSEIKIAVKSKLEDSRRWLAGVINRVVEVQKHK